MTAPRPKMVHQEELPFANVQAHTLWPGRTVLYVREVARELRCVEQHVINLIEIGRLGALDVSTGRPYVPGKDKLHRQALRVPVAAWDEFIKTSRTI